MSTEVSLLCTAQPVASTSKLAPAEVVCEPGTSDKVDKLTQLLNGFIKNLPFCV